MTDKYQERYLAHQEKKKEQLQYSKGEKPKPITDPIRQRRSQRLFNTKPITDSDLLAILDAARYAPNSCNRHGIRLKVVSDRADKSLLSGILVGGVGWVHRAQHIALFFADPEAYKSPNEKEFMHYCDVGFTAMNMWLMAEQRGIGACYINPNCSHKDILARYGSGIFCGALALGHYDVRVTQAEHPSLDDILC